MQIGSHSSYDPHRHLRYLDGHAGTAADEQICQRGVGGTQVDRVGVGVGEWASKHDMAIDQYLSGHFIFKEDEHPFTSYFNGYQGYPGVQGQAFDS